MAALLTEPSAGSPGFPNNLSHCSCFQFKHCLLWWRPQPVPPGDRQPSLHPEARTARLLFSRLLATGPSWSRWGQSPCAIPKVSPLWTRCSWWANPLTLSHGDQGDGPNLTQTHNEICPFHCSPEFFMSDFSLPPRKADPSMSGVEGHHWCSWGQWGLEP